MDRSVWKVWGRATRTPNGTLKRVGDASAIELTGGDRKEIHRDINDKKDGDARHDFGVTPPMEWVGPKQNFLAQRRKDAEKNKQVRIRDIKFWDVGRYRHFKDGAVEVAR